jgi:hypothetical protein
MGANNIQTIALAIETLHQELRIAFKIGSVGLDRARRVKILLGDQAPV